jgi:hypothetical protein
VAAGYNKLRSWVTMAESMADKYDRPPTPIDFAAAKKNVRDTGLVEMMEQFYTTQKPPIETHIMPESEHTRSKETIAYLEQLNALHKEFLPVLEKEIEFCKSSRTTRDTTVHDLRLNYPLIHEEIEDELERREWFKDTGYGSSAK